MFASTLLTLAITLAAPADKDGKAEPGKIEGNWIVEKYIQGGKENEKRKGSHFTFKDGEVSVQEEGGKGIAYKVDPKANPATLDLTAAGGILGVYKIDGDTLTICFPKGEKGERPKKFESPEGSELVLMVLKREKK
ncbi:MAG: TIGR03067 domain-containing protein [Gemmataceae bacterium]|nr:TIGR03067 domain-containing protein [Gemmataceae bacterium]